MTPYEKNHKALERAIKKMGGQSNAAKTITKRLQARGITKILRNNTVWSWLSRDKCGVPLEYLVDVEEESGVARTELRTDVPWIRS